VNVVSRLSPDSKMSFTEKGSSVYDTAPSEDLGFLYNGTLNAKCLTFAAEFKQQF